MATSSLALRSLVALILFVGFYVFALSVAGGLLWLAWQLIQLEATMAWKAIWGCVAAAGVVLWSMRPRVDHFNEPGPRVTEADQPELFSLIRDVSAAAKQPVPRDVFIAGDVSAWVADRGGISGIGGHRVMTVGLPLLQELTVDELKAVIAHEFGHFSGGDTKLGRLVHRTHGAIVRTLAETEGRLIELMFRLYAVLFLRVSMAVSRAQEFAADAFAARLTGPAVLASSLAKTERTSLLFWLYRDLEYLPLVHAGYRPPFAAGFTRFRTGFTRFRTRPMATSVNGRTESTPVERSPYDSHPPNTERIAALRSMSPAAAMAADPRPAIALLRDVPALERALLEFDGTDVAKLSEITWDEVPERVWVPTWRATVEKNAKVLREIAVEDLPISTSAALAVGRLFGIPQVKLMDPDDLAAHVERSARVAVALRLHDAGWTLEDHADGARLQRGNDVIDLFDLEPIVAETPEARVGWTNFRQLTGLSGRLV